MKIVSMQNIVHRRKLGHQELLTRIMNFQKMIDYKGIVVDAEDNVHVCHCSDCM